MGPLFCGSKTFARHAIYGHVNVMDHHWVLSFVYVDAVWYLKSPGPMVIRQRGLQVPGGRTYPNDCDTRWVKIESKRHGFGGSVVETRE